MELRHLRSMLVLAEELHFGRAADRLGIAQPALSRQIQQLETELQARLFRRSPRAVSLTDAGREFVENIGPAIQQIEDAAAGASNFARAKRGRIRAASSGNLSAKFIPELLQRLQRESPLVRVDVRQLSAAEQIRTLHAAEIDVGLATLPINDPSLIVRRILSEPLVLMVRSESEFANRASVRLRDLAEERFIICPRYRRTGFHEVVIEHAAKAGFRPRIAHEIDAPSTAVALVERGLGVAVVPRSEAWPISDRVRCLPISDPAVFIEIAAIWRRENMSPLVRCFVDCAAQLGREMEAKRSPRLLGPNTSWNDIERTSEPNSYVA
jgi:DNA-binding transcriptional LysR family regulator